jgi:hypothetical protein
VSSSLATVRDVLQHYASRGAFRSFSEVAGRGRLAAFEFIWFRDVKFRVTYDQTTRTLTFVDLLPEVPARSEMARQFRAFIESRSATGLPDHRRVDPRRLKVSIVNRKGSVSLAMVLSATHAEYGVKKAVHLVHEVLMDFLNESLYVEYCIAHFNLNPEMA